MPADVALANPYLRCDQCKAPVRAFRNLLEGEGPATNQPCGHRVGATSVCPSWGPVDGCTCLRALGEVPHGGPDE